MQPSKLPESMRAIAIREPGGPEVLQLVQRPVPTPAAGEVLIKVAFAGVNRPDVHQRNGGYPPPAGASDLPGLEVSGHVVARGEAASRWSIGAPVCALLAGGGYAEFAVADERHCLAVPEGLSLQAAAALPETVFTVWANVFERGRLAAGETLLVQGGTSGIGTTAIHLAKLFGARVLATAGSPAKTAFCRSIGADGAIDYRAERFETRTLELTAGKGVDVILDIVGAPYLDRHLQCLAQGGRLVIIGLQGGSEGPVDLRRVLGRHLTITASTLRPRSADEKARLAREVAAQVWPFVADGRLRPCLDRLFPLAAAAAAHTRLETGDHIGKVTLEV